MHRIQLVCERCVQAAETAAQAGPTLCVCHFCGKPVGRKEGCDTGLSCTTPPCANLEYGMGFDFSLANDARLRHCTAAITRPAVRARHNHVILHVSEPLYGIK